MVTCLSVGKDLSGRLWRKASAMEIKSLHLKPSWFVIVCAILVSMNSVLPGYSLGTSINAITEIRKEFRMSFLPVQVLVATPHIISVAGAGVLGKASDVLGRRWTMALGAVVYLIGSLVITVAPISFWVYVGRILYGVAVDCTLYIASLYMAEFSPASTRGSIVCILHIFTNLGVAVSFVSRIVIADSGQDYNWRTMVKGGMVLPLFALVGVLAIPESPRWLCMRDRNDEALKVLVKTSESREEASARLVEILNGIQYAQLMREQGNETVNYLLSGGEGTWAEMYRPTPVVKRMLMVAMGVNFFQQASGIISIVYYFPVVSSSLASVEGVAVVWSCTCSVAAAFLVDRIGRRPLLLLSAVGMALSMLTLSVSLICVGDEPAQHTVAAYVGGIALCGAIGSFNFGFGPLNWVLTSEIFPVRLRAKACYLSIVINETTCVVISMTFLTLCDEITLQAVLFVYGVMSVLAAAFVYCYVPETKGKTLEQIAADFYMNQAEITIRHCPSDLMIWNPQKTTVPETEKGELPWPMGVL